jgi:hypothetical protein
MESRIYLGVTFMIVAAFVAAQYTLVESTVTYRGPDCPDASGTIGPPSSAIFTIEMRLKFETAADQYAFVPSTAIEPRPACAGASTLATPPSSATELMAPTDASPANPDQYNLSHPPIGSRRSR